MTDQDDATPALAPQMLLFPTPKPTPLDPSLAAAPGDLVMGRLYATPAAIDYLGRHGVAAGALLGRHWCADPGELDPDDIAANDAARRHGGRVLSAFAYGQEREAIWVITEADRSATTLLLPSDY